MRLSRQRPVGSEVAPPAAGRSPGSPPRCSWSPRSSARSAPARGPRAGATVRFTVAGRAVCGGAGQPACPVAGPDGRVSLASAIIPRRNVGIHAGQVGASFVGDPNHRAASADGPLVVARRLLWVQPVDRTVARNAPNRPATPPANCLASQNPDPGMLAADRQQLQLRLRGHLGRPRPLPPERRGAALRLLAQPRRPPLRRAGRPDLQDQRHRPGERQLRRPLPDRHPHRRAVAVVAGQRPSPS